MRYRALSPTGDYQFGKAGIFFMDSPQAVAQAIQTRLALWTGEWFLDATEGTQWVGGVVGHNTQATRDLVIKERVLDTPGVVSIDSYGSSVANRVMTATARVTTAYGAATITTTGN